MKKGQIIHGINILILCLFALISVGEGNYIENPQFQTEECDIDPLTHTCIVEERAVRPWRTTQRSRQLELSNLAQLFLLFHSPSKVSRPGLLFCVIRQFEQHIISQPFSSMVAGTFILTFDVIGGDLNNQIQSASLFFRVSAGETSKDQRTVVPLDGYLYKRTLSFTLSQDFTQSRGYFEFYLLEKQRSGVTVAVTNLNFQPYTPHDPNKIVNGKFNRPHLRPEQDFRRVTGTQVEGWTIKGYGFIAHWANFERSITQCFMFRAQEFKIKQNFQLKQPGFVRVSFVFYYRSHQDAKGVLLVKTGNNQPSQLMLDPNGEYRRKIIYEYHSQGIACQQGFTKFSIKAKSLTLKKTNIYFSDVKIVLMSKIQQTVRGPPALPSTRPVGGAEGPSGSQSGPHRPPAAGASGGAQPTPADAITLTNFIRNGNFEVPKIPQSETQIRVKGRQVRFWTIQGSGWIKRLQYLENPSAQWFLFFIRLGEYVQLSQKFFSKSSLEATLSFFYQLDSLPDPQATLQVSFNDMYLKMIYPKDLIMGNMYTFESQINCIEGWNKLSFLAKTSQDLKSEVAIYFVQINPKAEESVQPETQEDSKKGSLRKTKEGFQKFRKSFGKMRK